MTTISETRAYQLYYNYYVNGNSLNTPPEMMGKIVSEYSNKVKEWQTEITKDTNIYYFPEDEFEEWVKYGEEYAANQTGYDNDFGDRRLQEGNNVLNQAGGAATTYLAATNGAFPATGEFLGNVAKGAVEGYGKAKSWFSGLINGKDAATGAAGEVAKDATAEAAKEATTEVAKETATEATEQVAKEATEQVATEATEQVTTEATEQVTTEATEEGAKASAKDISAVVGCCVALATWVLYMITKPNKEQYKALMEMNEQLKGAQGDLAAQQAIMEAAAAETTALAEEAEARNEDANNVMSESEAKYKLMALTLSTLEARISAGEQLSPEEVELYQLLQEMMAAESATIKETGEDVESEVGEIYTQMGERQADFDTSAETIATVQGEHDYAKSFDRMTQILCGLTGISQAANAVSGIANAVRLATMASNPFGFWLYVFVTMGLTGGVGSAVAAIEQAKMAIDIQGEIRTRKDTNDVIGDTQATYDNELNNFFMGRSTVEDLELEVPEGTDAPTGSSVPQTSVTTGTGTENKEQEDTNNKNKK